MTRLVLRLLVIAGLAVLLFFAYLTAIRLAFMFFYFSILLIATCWAWTRLASRGLAVQRDTHEGAYEVGQEFREHLEVVNESIVGTPWVAIEDQSGIPGYDASRVFSLTGRGRRRWMTSGRLTTRGRYSLGPLRLTTGDPFGLFQRSRTVPVSAAITIYPRLVDVDEFLPGSMQNSGESRVFGRYSDSPPDALGIREHDPSDGFNRIHWPSTARLGRPMSRAFERYEGADTVIVLDLAAAAHPGGHPRPTLEYGVSLAASVAMTAAGRGQSVALRCNNAAGTTIHAAAGAAHLRRILDFLAVASADGSRGLETALAYAAGGSAQRSIVVITPAAPAAWVDSLASARDGGRRVTVLHVGGTLGDHPRVRTIGEMSWWELGLGPNLAPDRAERGPGHVRAGSGLVMAS